MHPTHKIRQRRKARRLKAKQSLERALEEADVHLKIRMTMADSAAMKSFSDAQIAMAKGQKLDIAKEAEALRNLSSESRAAGEEHRQSVQEAHDRYRRDCGKGP